MLGDLTTSLTQIPDDQLDKLFEGVSDALPNANNLSFGKDATSLGDIKDIKDDGELEKIIEGKVDLPAAEVPKEGEPAKPAEVVKPAEAAKPEPAKEEEKVVPNELYKNSVNFLVEKGLFKDFEGREELDVDDNTFAELLEAQVNAIVEERYNSQKQSLGEYGQAIIDFIEKDGDPDKIIDLFKEQQAVQQFEIKEEGSQEALITQYYKDVLEWTPSQIKRHLNTLKTEENALEEEAQTIKGKYDQFYQKQVTQLQAEQEAFLAQKQESQKKYEASLKGAIKDYGVDDQTKRKLETALFKQKTVELNGQSVKVNDFYLKFAQLQQDPKAYIEFVEFVMDKENYMKRQATQQKNEVATKTWKFVKGGAAVSKNTGSAHQEVPVNESKVTGPDFSSLLKKR